MECAAVKRNPWALTDEQARARDDAILTQYLAAVERADKFGNEAQGTEWLKRQFGHPEVRSAMMRAVVRRQASR